MKTATDASIGSIELPKLDAKKKRMVIFGAIGTVVAVWAIHFAYLLITYETTDDAQVAAHSAVLAAKVGGIVDSVLVDENQSVKAGDVLARIDSRDYQNAVRQAEGELGSLQARLRDAEKNYTRMEVLFKKDAVSQQQRDDAEAAYQDLLRHSQSTVAQLDQAKLNLAYTEIKAPTDGKLGKKSVEPGMVVAPGQALFTFVESSDRWVIANFKETQLRKMQLGQPVDIEIDAISGHTFTGRVESFSPSSGATFALIPPDNATGNFTKIVQRVPVKVVFDRDSIRGLSDRIVPGISAVVSVRVR